MNDLRIAVVGVGGIAQRYHLPSLKRLAEEGAPIRRAALCDLDAARAREMAARYGFERAYTDYRAMLDAEAPDAVWALVPTAAMREVAGYFLAQGVPILMEKPPARNAREVREMIEIARARGTPHQVAFNRRYAPLLRRMKELLVEGGAVSAVSCQFYRHNRGEADFGYGTGIHGLDTLRFLGDCEVREVYTRPGPRASALVTLVYESGAHALMEMLPQVGVQSERYTAHVGERTVVVEGVIGWLTLFPGFLQCFERGRLAFSVDNVANPAPAEVVSGFYGESAHFIANLAAGRSPAPTLDDALRSVEIAEAVNAGQSVAFR